VPDETQSKLDDKAKECRLIGFEGDSIYMVVDADRKRLCSCNVIFIEGQAACDKSAGSTPMEFQSQDTEAARDDDKGTHSISEDNTSKQRTRSEVWGTDPTRRSEHISNKVLITKTNSDTPEIKTPRNYEEAVNSPEEKLWRDAMDYELAKLEEMNTWDEIDESDVPSSAQVLPGMWVHLVKKLESGDKKFCSRWVVRGDKQKTNLSLSKTFTPVSHISSLRVLLALATLKNLHIFAWDIDSAYLHRKMDHYLYIALPDGYGKPC